ncbi:hypothetical protein SK803_33855 [Lentzea sp. BCCO 10_0856]|uniref:Phage protein n=1 Tax=Lentzea miocenica TaxID=3095431 RepID=A0ABU4TAM6_9PSEU|nr:hypothetical protein [Lentzea sp. BCCO 10_0856]MDX8035225.1 hypothetical protein [Lentzea sp. BCCO 10_0856]
MPSFRAVISPYITAWTAEQDLPNRIVQRRGIGYATELQTDRDLNGVLWQQTPQRQGSGRPEFGRAHPLRQRRAMELLLCQVCGGPASRTGDGVLWLHRDHRDDWPGWPEGMASVEPPVCASCVAVSLRHCPALRKGAVAVSVRDFPIAGVRGLLHRPGVWAPAPVSVVNMAYEDPAVRWVQASALVRELRGCTLVEFEELAGAVA